MKAAVLAIALAAATSAFACEPGLANARRVEGKTFVVAWVADPAALKTGEFFAVEAAACAKDGTVSELRVDAWMPEHKHGMNYRPVVKGVSAGRFRAEGLLLHMPGVWEFTFDARGGGKQEVLRQRITVN